MGFGSFGGLVSGAIGAASSFLPDELGEQVGAAAGIAGDTFAAQANLDEAQAARDFTKSTYLNRYQWTMSDMRKAGLNPILAYQQGAGGAMPGAMGKVSSSTGAVLPAINTAIQARLAKQKITQQEEQIKNTKEDTKLKKTQQHATQNQAYLTTAQELNTMAQTGVHSAQANRIRQETINQKLEQFRHEAIAEGAKSEEEILKTTLGKYLRWIDVIGRSINPMTKATTK